MHPYLCPFIWVAGLSIVAEAALPSTAAAAAALSAAAVLASPAEGLAVAAPAACWSALSYLGARGLSPLQLADRRRADANST